ncbi:MAG: ABC transporter permease [Opitutaceae bacterium]
MPPEIAAAELHHVIPHFSIRPRKGWQVINFTEILAYRDLFYFLVWRDVKVRYAQSILGIGWAIIQPLFQTLIFTLIFSRVESLQGQGGDTPYLLFSLCATVPWAFFSTSLNEASNVLVGQAHMITKVYFPRLILPITAVLGKLLDLGIAFVLASIVLIFYGRVPQVEAIFLPVLIVAMILTASGLGMLLTALAVQYRDIRYAMTFLVQLLMYVSPVIFSTSAVIPENLQLVYALNPMVGVIEGFRAALLGDQAMPWLIIGVSCISSVAIFVLGALYFRRMERFFADVA